VKAREIGGDLDVQCCPSCERNQTFEPVDLTPEPEKAHPDWVRCADCSSTMSASGNVTLHLCERHAPVPAVSPLRRKIEAVLPEPVAHDWSATDDGIVRFKWRSEQFRVDEYKPGEFIVELCGDGFLRGSASCELLAALLRSAK
jgi:hypothetical protein